MEWRFPADDGGRLDPNGIERIMELVSAEVGGTVQATRFLADKAQMMKMTREIEAAATSELLVGFQRADRLEPEIRTYERLAGKEVRVTAFGTGHPEAPPPLAWVEVPFDRAAVENQWFLVAPSSDPVAFVGYEVSTHRGLKHAGLSDPDRRFAGFLSKDPRVVTSLVDHLHGVIREHPG